MIKSIKALIKLKDVQDILIKDIGVDYKDSNRVVLEEFNGIRKLKVIDIYSNEYLYNWDYVEAIEIVNVED